MDSPMLALQEKLMKLHEQMKMGMLIPEEFTVKTVELVMAFLHPSSLERGMEQAANCELEDHGSFAHHITED